MLFAPAVDASDLRRIVANLNTLQNWNKTSPDSSEVKLDFGLRKRKIFTSNQGGPVRQKITFRDLRNNSRCLLIRRVRFRPWSRSRQIRSLGTCGNRSHRIDQYHPCREDRHSLRQVPTYNNGIPSHSPEKFSVFLFANLIGPVPQLLETAFS